MVVCAMSSKEKSFMCQTTMAQAESIEVYFGWGEPGWSSILRTQNHCRIAFFKLSARSGFILYRSDWAIHHYILPKIDNDFVVHSPFDEKLVQWSYNCIPDFSWIWNREFSLHTDLAILLLHVFVLKILDKVGQNCLFFFCVTQGRKVRDHLQ